MPRGFASFSPEKRKAVATKGGRSTRAPDRVEDRVLTDAESAVVHAARNWSRARNVTESRLYNIALEARVAELEDLLRRRALREQIMGKRTGRGAPLRASRK